MHDPASADSVEPVIFFYRIVIASTGNIFHHSYFNQSWSIFAQWNKLPVWKVIIRLLAIIPLISPEPCLETNCHMATSSFAPYARYERKMGLYVCCEANGKVSIIHTVFPSNELRGQPPFLGRRHLPILSIVRGKRKSSSTFVIWIIKDYVLNNNEVIIENQADIQKHSFIQWSQCVTLGTNKISNENKLHANPKKRGEDHGV